MGREGQIAKEILPLPPKSSSESVNVLMGTPGSIYIGVGMFFLDRVPLVPFHEDISNLCGLIQFHSRHHRRPRRGR